MNAMQKRLEARISGRVQMVMFRDFTKRQARRLGLTGFVRNETDGTVLVIAEGEEAELKKLLSKIATGPMFSRVEDLEVGWADPRGTFRDFVIDYS